MKVVVIYESLTGNTRRAAEVAAARMQERGATVSVCNVTAIDHQALSEADLVVVGSWVDGILVVGQRPGRAARIARMPVVAGKRCVVYCTYALNPGKTLDKMTRLLTSRGAEVLGGMAIRRNDIEAGAARFADRVMEELASA